MDTVQIITVCRGYTIDPIIIVIILAENVDIYSAFIPCIHVGIFIVLHNYCMVFLFN